MFMPDSGLTKNRVMPGVTLSNEWPRKNLNQTQGCIFENSKAFYVLLPLAKKKMSHSCEQEINTTLVRLVFWNFVFFTTKN